MLCDKKVPIKLKDKVYKTVIKPTMTYGAECGHIRRREEDNLSRKIMDMVVPGREEGGGLDGDGLTTTEKI